MNAAARVCLMCCAFACSSAGIRADSNASATAMEELVRRPVIASTKLADMRGGLSIAGLDYSVGAVMRTLVDGSVVLESAIDLGSMDGVAVTNNIVLNDAKGLTRITHDLSENKILATVVNQANQREIQVQLDINVTLHNYDDLKAASFRNRILDSLSGILGH